MTKFTGMFSSPAGSVSASGTIALDINVDAAAGASIEQSIWGRISGGTGSATLSNYILKATLKAGFPHTGSASTGIADSTLTTPLDINSLWSVNGDSVWFDGNLNPTIINNGLNLDGTKITGTVRVDATQISGTPDITTSITLTGPAVPTLYNLAEMNGYAYNYLTAVPTGWFVVRDDTVDSYRAVVFANDRDFSLGPRDVTEVVIDVRGTVNLSNQYADLSFYDSDTEPNATFREYVSLTAQLLEETRQAFPNAHITLTGHSLGGSLVQLVGNASHYSTVAFDAPGALQFNGKLQNELAPALALGEVNSHPEANVDIRPVGDGFSLIDQSGTINLMTLISKGQLYPDTQSQILNNHGIDVLLAELAAPGTKLSFGAIEPDAGVLSFGTASAFTPIRMGLGENFVKYTFFLAPVFEPVADQLHRWFDPNSGSQIIYQGRADSPDIGSVDFLADPHIASYKVWTQTNGTWSAPQTVTAGTTVSFAASVHAVKIEGLSASGQVIALPDGFLFGATFASSGQVNANVHSINFDTLNGTNVQTSAPGQTTLNVNSSFNYTDAGNGNLTVNGTASGNDTILLGSGNKTVNLGSGNDFVMVKAGATGNVLVHGGVGSETILAGAANVTLVADSGDILFIGGDDANANVGVNTIDYSASGGPVSVNLATGVIQTGNGAITTLVNVENVSGSAFTDLITGDTRPNVLNGSAGADVLTGGAGNDKFVFDMAALTDAKAATPLFDEVTDYASGDQLDLSALLMTAYNHGIGQPVSSLVRAIEDVSGTFANLQVDPDGAVNGANWITIARLDGIQIGNSLNVILDSALSAGSAIGVTAFPGSVSINDATIAEGNSGTKVETFTVTRSGGTAAFDVNFTTADGTATTADHDYVANFGTLHFAAGVNTQTISVTINGDTKLESSETFLINLSGATNGTTISDNSALGIIADDDGIRSPHEFNGDGKNDFLWRNDDGSVATWDMNDRSSSGAVIANVSNDWHIADTGDFNGDGKSDILWRNDSGAVATWNMNDRSYDGLVIGTVTNDWHIAGTGDFNGDHKTDILWRNDNGAVATWDMNDRSSSGAVIATVTNDWHIAGTGDFNGDGKTDILWRNDNGSVATWDMNDRSSSGAVIANVSNDWHIAGTGDFNGDGKTDILWRNDNGAVATWDMNDRSSSGAVIATVTNDWHIAGTGDFNGDHKTDILWHNDNGSVATWDMNDHSYSGAVIATAPNDWHIV